MDFLIKQLILIIILALMFLIEKRSKLTWNFTKYFFRIFDSKIWLSALQTKFSDRDTRNIYEFSCVRSARKFSIHLEIFPIIVLQNWINILCITWHFFYTFEWWLFRKWSIFGYLFRDVHHRITHFIYPWHNTVRIFEKIHFSSFVAMYSKRDNFPE